MTRTVEPLANRPRRLPELGRIRIGIRTTSRNGKEIPTSIDTFRFTSADRTALTQVAAIYGGDVKAWSDPKAAPGQHEVITAANEINVVLPPDCLGGSPIYELWGGGGCERRCDGVICTQMERGPDGIEPVDRPCLCFAAGTLKCDVKTRLSVILPEIRFGGVWRLDTKSDFASKELPGMVDLLESMQERGLTTGVLRLEQRRSQVAGETHHFVVPVLGLADSLHALAAGATRFGALGAAPALPVSSEGGELPSSSTNGPPLPSGAASSSDDDVVDAEIVETPDHLACTRCGGSLAGCAVAIVKGGKVHKDGCPDKGSAPDGPGETAGARDSGLVGTGTAGETSSPALSDDLVIGDLDIFKLCTAVFGAARELVGRGHRSKVIDACRHALTHLVTEGRTHHCDELTVGEKHKLWVTLQQLADGFLSWELEVHEGAPVAFLVAHGDDVREVAFADLEVAA